MRAAVLYVLLSAVGQFAAALPPCDLLISKANVLDLEEKKIRANQDIFISEGIITSVRDHSEDAGAQCRETVFAEGKFVMPGLVDMHTHANAIFLPRPGDYTSITNTIPLTLEQSGAMMLRAGVTAFLDLCSVKQDVIFSMRDKQRQNRLKIDMPDIFAAGSCITSKWFDRSGDPNQFNDEKEIADVTLLEKVRTHRKAYPEKDGVETYGYEVPEKLSELEKIDRLLDKNPDVLKVFYTISWDEGAHFPSLHLDTIREIVKRAHARKVPVLAHALEWREQVPVLATGIDGLAHGATDAKPENGWSELKEWKPKKPMIVVPTVTVFNGLGRLGSRNKEFEDPLLLAVLDAVSPKVKDQVIREFSKMNPKLKWAMTNLTAAFNKQYDDFMIANIKRYKRDERFNVLMGSDASNLGAFLGFSMHQELSSMVNDMGYSQWEALYRATIEPGKFLKKKYGTGKGDIANLVILDKSPIAEIENTRLIRRVILRGKALPEN